MTPTTPAVLVRSLDGLFAAFQHRHLIYNACIEDPAADRAAFDLSPDDRVLVITSGGCNALDYLLAGAGAVNAVDLNPCQNALLEFKVAAIRSLDHAAFWELLGAGRSPRPREMYHDAVRRRLSPPARLLLGPAYPLLQRSRLAQFLLLPRRLGPDPVADGPLLEGRPPPAPADRRPVRGPQPGGTEARLRDAPPRPPLDARVLLAEFAPPAARLDGHSRTPARGHAPLPRRHVSPRPDDLRGTRRGDSLRHEPLPARLSLRPLHAHLLPGISHARRVRPPQGRPARPAHDPHGVGDGPPATDEGRLFPGSRCWTTWTGWGRKRWRTNGRPFLSKARPGARAIFRSALPDVDYLYPIEVEHRGRRTALGDLLRFDRDKAAALHARDRVHLYGSFHIAHLPGKEGR